MVGSRENPYYTTVLTYAWNEAIEEYWWKYRLEIELNDWQAQTMGIKTLERISHLNSLIEEAVQAAFPNKSMKSRLGRLKKETRKLLRKQREITRKVLRTMVPARLSKLREELGRIQGILTEEGSQEERNGR